MNPYLSAILEILTQQEFFKTEGSDYLGHF
jgi:hypothetical protein